MQKIIPFLWYNGNIQEVADFYTSVFKNSRVVDNRKMAGGVILSATIEVEGQQFIAFHGGPKFPFTPAISFFINCDTQQEVDELWEKLLQGGGVKSRCGWLQDKYGLSWQVIPTALGRLMGDPDPVKAKRVMDAMLKMDKIDANVLQQAYDGNIE